MPEFTQQFVDWITRSPNLAYVAMFSVLIVSGIGVPIAEELVVVTAGFLFQRQVVELLPAWGVCYVGVLLADSIVVYMGWHFGRAILHRRRIKRWLHPRRLLWAHHQVHDHGAWVIAASKFIPGGRWPTLLIAGMLRLPRWKFLLADAGSSMVTVSLQMAAGYLLGHLSTLAWEKIDIWMTLGSIALGVLLLTAYILWRRRYGGQRKPLRLGRFRLTRRRRRANEPT